MTVKKKRNAAIALGVGVVTLTTAVFANYSNANGYTVYKEAIKGLLKERNYTATLSANVSFDGQEVLTAQTMQQLAMDNEGVKMYRSDNSVDGNINNVSEEAYQNGMRVSSYNGNRYSVYESDHVNSMFYAYGDDNDAEMMDKAVRFAELAADMFVGDLKNNFTFVTEDNGIYQYDLTLEGIQIPEIVNAGLSLVSATNYTDEEIDELVAKFPDDPSYMLWKCRDLTATKAGCAVKVDDAGRLVNNTLTAEVLGTESDGTTHTIAITIALDVTDYGTTQPTGIDLTGKSYVLDSDNATYVVNADGTKILVWSADGGQEYGYSYNEDGSIEILDVNEDGSIG